MRHFKTGLVADHEVLTPSGWVSVSKIDKVDVIATWCPSGAIRFSRPYNIDTTESDDMVTFNNYQGHLSQHVNMYHNVVYYTKSGKLKICRAIDAKPNPYSKHPLAGKLLSSFGDSEISDYERFLIVLQSTGSTVTRKIRYGKHRGYVSIRFYFKKKDKIERFINILDSLDYDYITKCDNIKKGLWFTVWSPVSLDSIRFGTWIDLFTKSYTWCRGFIDEVKYWNGHTKGHNNASIVCSSSDKKRIDIIQAISVLCDMRTCYSYVEGSDDVDNNKYRVNILTTSNESNGKSINKNNIALPKSKMFYNFEVPSGFIITRHNNAVSIICDSKNDINI